MARTTKAKEIELLVATIIHGIQERKGKNIVTMDLRNIPNTVCDFFVICTGDSNTHVEGISGSIQETTKKELTDRPWHVEGMGNSEWVLLDYVNVVVHVFQREPRDFYNIERLWADAIVTEHAEDGTTLVLPQIPKKIPVKKEKKAKPIDAKKAASKARTSKSAPARPKTVAKAQTEGVKEYKGRVKAKPRTAASTTGAKTVEVTFTEVKPRAKAAAKPRTRESAPRSASTAKPETRTTTSRSAATAKPKATATKPKAVEGAAKPKAATTKAKPKAPTAKPKAAAKPNTRKA